jgi:hypothetical protein
MNQVNESDTEDTESSGVLVGPTILTSDEEIGVTIEAETPTPVAETVVDDDPDTGSVSDLLPIESEFRPPEVVESGSPPFEESLSESSGTSKTMSNEPTKPRVGGKGADDQ